MWEGRRHSLLVRCCICHHFVTMTKHLNEINVQENKVFDRVIVSELWVHVHDISGSTQRNKTAYLLAARNQSKQEWGPEAEGNDVEPSKANFLYYFTCCCDGTPNKEHFKEGSVCVAHTWRVHSMMARKPCYWDVRPLCDQEAGRGKFWWSLGSTCSIGSTYAFNSD